MSSPAAETLALIRDTLVFLKEEPLSFFANKEDADFFRKGFKPVKGIEPLQIPITTPLPEPQAEILKKEPARQVVAIQPEPPKAAIPAPARLSISEPKQIEKPLPKPPKIEPIKTPAPQGDFRSLREILSKTAPGFPILDEIPDDAIAKKIANRWKTKNQTAPISLLAFQEPPAQRALLEQIAKAIDVYFGPAKIVAAETIEKEKQWEAFLSVSDLKLVIACDYTLWQLGSLMQFYKENPAQGTRHLGAIPIFLLPDLSLYLKDPLLKRSLWKALCQTLAT